MTKQETIGARPIGSTGEEVLPQQQFSQVPQDSYAPGDCYEMLFLKYADVSEVIGLLAEGKRKPGCLRDR